MPIKIEVEAKGLIKLGRAWTDYGDDLHHNDLLNAAEEIQPTVINLFDRTTKTWKHKVKVKSEIKSKKNKEFTVETENDDFIWNLQNDGTPPHKIRAKTSSGLSFLSNYSAKTTPYKIDSKSGGASGNRVYVVEVNHPGTTARRWDVVITKSLDKSVPITLDKSIEKSLNKRFNRNF